MAALSSLGPRFSTLWELHGSTRLQIAWERLQARLQFWQVGQQSEGRSPKHNKYRPLPGLRSQSFFEQAQHGIKTETSCHTLSNRSARNTGASHNVHVKPGINVTFRNFNTPDQLQNPTLTLVHLKGFIRSHTCPEPSWLPGGHRRRVGL